MALDKTAKAIATLRKQAGYTQATLADKLGVSDKAVSKWERGIAYPDVSLWNKLSILLDTDIENLLYGLDNDSLWKGVWVIDSQIDPFTVVYNKPLYEYVLSQFLLVGINHIYIIGKCNQITSPGINIEICEDINQVNHRLSDHVFLIMGNSFMYGPNLTKHFMRAMSRENATTVIATMKKKGECAISVDTERKAHLTDKMRSNQYFAEPYVFFAGENSFKLPNDVRSIILEGNINVETMVRGMLAFRINNFNELLDMSGFVKMMEGQTGETIGCLEEIAHRRGLING